MPRITASRLVALGAAVLGVWFYFTPHLAVRGMRQAAEVHDAATLSSYVNFPALRENLKSTVASKLQNDLLARAKARGREDSGSKFAAAMVAGLVNPIVDKLITPESLARIMITMRDAKRERPPQPQDRAPTESGKPRSGDEATDAEKQRKELAMSYEAFNRFVVTAKHQDKPGEAAALIFTREGLLDWKLTGIRLPD